MLSWAIKITYLSSNGTARWQFLGGASGRRFANHAASAFNAARPDNFTTLVSRQRAVCHCGNAFFARSYEIQSPQHEYTQPAKHCVCLVWFGECARRACIISMVTRHNGKQNKEGGARGGGVTFAAAGHKYTQTRSIAPGQGSAQ